MGVVVVASSEPSVADDYFAFLCSMGWDGELVDAGSHDSPETLIESADGLLLADGLSVAPQTYGYPRDLVPDVAEVTSYGLDEFHLSLTRTALSRNLPILGISRGMHLLNIAFGGTLLQNIPGHIGSENDKGENFAKHSIYMSPGSKLAAILGMGGFFRVNSHHRGGLREAQRSPRLLSSAYSLEDGVVEGLESPEHGWVLGIQCRPDRRDEVPAVFKNIFISFSERAQEHSTLK